MSGWDRSKTVGITRKQAIDLGLYFGPEDRVNVASFERCHPVVLSDGRRFVTAKCALVGTKRDSGLKVIETYVKI